MNFNTKIARMRDRFISFLRSLPEGQELTTAEVCEWLYLPDDPLVDVVLAPVKEAGLVKSRESQWGRLWSLN